MERLNVLLLAAELRSNANTITDHIYGIATNSRHSIYVAADVLSYRGQLPKRLDLVRFDALILHYSLYLLNDSWLNGPSKDRIARFPGAKILFLQDEYRHVSCAKALIPALGIDALFTCVPEEAIEAVYPSAELPGILKIATLTGFVPQALVSRPAQRIEDRPIDVGYRARKVPYWLGELGTEKWRIAPKFLQAARGTGLVCDISYREEDRIYGEPWIEFVASCKAMLGVESGASVFDFTGQIQARVEEYLIAHSGADFEEVQGQLFRAEEGKIRLNQISPRCFEAAALRTAMVLYEGEYSGILKPWRHYIPLKKDFSNFAEVLAALRDVKRLQALANCTYDEVACDAQYSYATLATRTDDVIERIATQKGYRGRSPKYSQDEFDAAIAPPGPSSAERFAQTVRRHAPKPVIDALRPGVRFGRRLLERLR
jgi:hypothetical protein